jgi:hypothetical protein
MSNQRNIAKLFQPDKKISESYLYSFCFHRNTIYAAVAAFLVPTCLAAICVIWGVNIFSNWKNKNEVKTE